MDEIISNDIDISWMPFLYRDDILDFLHNVSKQYKNGVTSPNKKDILRFMKQDLLTAKYVLYGQDPYPRINGKMVATGRCFEPNNYTSWLNNTPNASIRNILRAIYGYDKNITNPSIDLIREDIKNNNYIISIPTTFFDNLEKQGIILLNYGLTVQDEPMSDINLWDSFQEKLIKYMNLRNPNLKYILWGSKVADLFKEASGINPYNNPDIAIVDKHPSVNKFVTENITFKLTPNINWH